MWYSRNSTSRTPLDRKIPKTIRFKVLFSSYDKFKEFLADRNIVEDSNQKFWYETLTEMIGNAYLKYTTDNKNKGHIAWQWKRFYKIYLRELDIYNRTVDTLNVDKVTSSQKAYRVNRTAEAELEAKFLDGGATQEQTITSSLIDKLDTLNEWANTADPESKFLSNIALAILKPVQPRERITYE